MQLSENQGDFADGLPESTSAAATAKPSPTQPEQRAATTSTPVAATPIWLGTRRQPPRGPRDPASPPRPTPRPTPLPKRPKGRLFTGSLLLILCTAIGYSVWDWQIRYQAHGVVGGRVLQVAPPWEGNVRTLQVREGDTVRQGQLLVTFSNIEQEQRIAEVADELKLAQATLEAQVSELRWQSQLRGDRNQKALGEYYEMWGELLNQRSQLSQAESELQRLQATREKNSLAVREKDLENARFAVAGMQAKTEKLAEAVAEMKKRVEIYEQFEDDASARILPELLRIKNLQAELIRLREVVQQGQVCSPVNGTVLKVHRFAGDHADVSQTVMDIVEDTTLEPVLYFPQRSADKLQVGDEVKIDISPAAESVTCRITRLGEQMEYAPPNIERYYRKNEKLLPVYLEPCHDQDVRTRMYLGSEIRLPRRWFPSRTSGDTREAERLTDNASPSVAG